jgi:putative component of membrane protein insertase Oxa1/YidC/SpoIIIJ protein YidD
MMSQVNTTVVRVSAFSVPYGDRGGISYSLAYCIIECTGPIEAHGIAIVPSYLHKNEKKKKKKKKKKKI